MSMSSNKNLKLRAAVSFVALNLILIVLAVITVPVYAGVNQSIEARLSNQDRIGNEEAPLGPYGDWNDEEIDETATPQQRSSIDALSMGNKFFRVAVLAKDNEDSSGYGDVDPEDNS